MKFLAKFDNKFVNFFKAPGKLLQKTLTTREPDEEMISVAIEAFKKVLEMDADATVPETEFVTSGILSKMLTATKEKFRQEQIDESDAEWIYSIALGVKRENLKNERIITSYESKKINKIVTERLTGRPLWYIIGDTEFNGCKIKVDERALIPRPETEILADYAVKSIEEGDKVLDLCTGSGCIAVSIAKNCLPKRVSVTASDLSDAAIMLAKENARYNSVSIDFVQSDLFTNVHGRYKEFGYSQPPARSQKFRTEDSFGRGRRRARFLQAHIKEHKKLSCKGRYSASRMR